MRRRKFIALAGGVIAWPSAACAQEAGKRPLVAVLTRYEPDEVSFFLKGLRDHGRIDGTNIRVEVRSAHGDATRLPVLAKDLVHLKPDVIVTSGAVLTAKELTETIPIVELLLFDPVGSGLIASLPRPSGNVTGIIFTLEGLPGKQLQLLRQTLPNLSRVGLIVTTTDATSSAIQRPHYEAAAAAMGVTLVTVEIRTREDFDGAFQRLTQAKVEALLETPSSLMFTERHDVAARTLAAGLPMIFNSRTMVEAGGLMSYGRAVDARGSNRRRIADFVDQILNGAKPADLPVEIPTKFEFVINLRTAKALRLEIPSSVLAIADEVIE